MKTILWDYESVWPNVWPQNICSTMWPLFCLISWKLFSGWTSYFGIMSQYDLTYDLLIFVGHYDLYFMVHWLCPLCWRLFDAWTSYFRIMSQYDTAFDLEINVGHSDLYLMVQWLLSFIFCSEKHFSFIGKARFRWATLSCDSSYFSSFQFRLYCPSRLFHSFWEDGAKNRRSLEKTPDPPTSRTWLVSNVTWARLEPTAVRWRHERVRALTISITTRPLGPPTVHLLTLSGSK